MAPRSALRTSVGMLLVAALVAIGLVSVASTTEARADASTFSYIAPTDGTPDPVQTFLVPEGVYLIQVEAEGGDGGQVLDGDANWAAGVKGATVSTLLDVNPGDELGVRVGLARRRRVQLAGEGSVLRRVRVGGVQPLERQDLEQDGAQGVHVTRR